MDFARWSNISICGFLENSACVRYAHSVTTYAHANSGANVYTGTDGYADSGTNGYTSTDGYTNATPY